MPRTSHATCTHPKTSGAYAACREGRPYNPRKRPTAADLGIVIQAAPAPALEVTDEMVQILRSASTLNGLVTVYVGAVGDEMVRAELLYEVDGDYFLDGAGYAWLAAHPAPAVTVAEVQAATLEPAPADACKHHPGHPAGDCTPCNDYIENYWRPKMAGRVVDIEQAYEEARPVNALLAAPAPAATHYDGDPDGCSDDCTGPHLDDAPEGHVCGGCGGGCYPVCLHQARPFEEHEGHTGAQELADWR